MEGDEDTFTSVNWDTPVEGQEQQHQHQHQHQHRAGPSASLPRTPHPSLPTSKDSAGASAGGAGSGGSTGLAGAHNSGQGPASGPSSMLARQSSRNGGGSNSSGGTGSKARGAGLVGGVSAGSSGRNDDDDDEAKRTPRWEGFLMVQVTEPRKEQEGSKEMFVSYGIRAETNLMHFQRTRLATRRRFQDFVFLREHLSKDFPACVVPPLPDKHRLEYFTGDRFSNEFLDRRTQDLQMFLERICRHPTLQRAQLLRSFLESSEWQVDMHSHISHTSALTHGSGSVEPSGGFLDSLSDTLLNAFSRVRKPDEKFEGMRERLERLEDGLGNTERVVQRTRSRHGAPLPSRISAPPLSPSSSQSRHSSSPTSSSPFARLRNWGTFSSASNAPETTQTHAPTTSELSSPFSSSHLFAPNMGLESQDLATDYEDLARSVEQLGYLESGITEPLNRFATTCTEWSRLQRSNSSRATNDMLHHLHGLLAYAGAHKNVLRLRDQKQVDFEALTDILSHEVTERDRLASLSSPYGAGHGHGGVRGSGIGGYLRDRLDSVRGVDEERTRVERMARLDGRIAQLQEEVTTSHDVSVAFSNEVQKEHVVFNLAKDQEMKVLLGTYVNGQMDMYQHGVDLWDALIPQLERIRTD